MIKQAGIICELMHAANVEYTKRYLDSLPKTRAMAEVQRLRVNAVPAPAAMAPAESAAEPENA